MRSLLVHSLIVIISILAADSAHGQGVMKFGEEPEGEVDTNLLIDAQVLLDGKPKKDVIIDVVYKGETIKSTKTKSDGFFELVIGFDTLVSLKFQEEGYVTKIIEVDTRNMPEEDRVRGYDAGLFKLSMIKQDETTPIGLYKKPIARFVYDPVSFNFVLDRQYKKEVKKSFKEINAQPDVIKF